jgi:hypothetical protein
LQRQHEELERQLQARRNAEQEGQRQQQDIRMSSERPHSAHETTNRHPFASHSPVPPTVELPQPVRPYPPIPGPRKSDPIPIKRHANHDQPSSHLSTSAPSSADGERPTKKQRHSESPVRLLFSTPR